MDRATATLIVGLLAGFIGLLSAVMSHLSLRFQLKKQSEESEQIRKHHLELQVHPKRLEAIEEVWLLLIKIEVDDTMSETQKDAYIKATLWLPEEVRLLSLTLLKHLDNKVDMQAVVSDIRHKLIELTIN